MSKPTENALLVPGASGWEIWASQPGAGFTLQRAHPTDRAADLTAFPNGDLFMLFPVRSFTAMPMRVTSDDDALFDDLAALHAERLGLRPDLLAGQLTDTFVIAKEAENSALLSIQLRTPAEGDLPTRGPKGFDVSARAFSIAGDGIALWKEFGRWVFAFFHTGQLAYCQATSISSSAPDAALCREIRLALIQLDMQGLSIQPTRIALWTDEEKPDITPLTAAFSLPIEVSPRPAPVLPQPLSKLLPADVRAARRIAQRRQSIILAAAAAVVLYLGLIGWFSYGLWKDYAETKQLTKQVEGTAPLELAYANHIRKWDELAPAIELKNSPVDILNRISRCIPANSGLRLRTADISDREIKLIGEGPQFQVVSSFSLALNKNNDLAQFKWSTPEPNQTNRGWEFNYTGEVPVDSAP